MPVLKPDLERIIPIEPCVCGEKALYIKLKVNPVGFNMVRVNWSFLCEVCSNEKV